MADPSSTESSGAQDPIVDATVEGATPAVEPAAESQAPPVEESVSAPDMTPNDDAAATATTTTTEDKPAVEETPAEPVKDAVEVALPDEDASELAWHKATIIAEEDIREQVIIPAQFAQQYLWTPTAAPTPAGSSREPGAHPHSHIVIPAALLADAHAALSSALSTSTQLASVHPRPPPKDDSSDDNATPSEPECLTEPIVTFFSPFDNTAAVIDTIVSGMGQSQRADVVVLDALMLAQGETGPLGPGLEKFFKELYGTSDTTDDEFKSRQIQRYLRALIDVQLPTDVAETSTSDASDAPAITSVPEEKHAEAEANPPSTDSKHGEEAPTETQSTKDGSADKATSEEESSDGDAAPTARPRIIYLKDFGGIASHAQPLLKELIHAVRARRLALQPTDSTKPWSSALLQPTTIIIGVSHSPENSPHNCCSACTWTKFMEGFESSDQEKLAHLLPDIIHPSVSKTTDNDVSKVIADALFTTPKRVNYTERTFVDPDVGTGAIYRQIICAYGFTDSRDPLIKVKKSTTVPDATSSGMKKVKAGDKIPDESVWRKGTSVAQKDRKEEFGAMRLARNEYIVRKALADLGGKMPEGVGAFSALPPEEEDEDDEAAKKKSAKGKGKAVDSSASSTTSSSKKKGSDKKKSKKTKEEIEAAKFTTIAGLKHNLLSRTVADRVAAIALHGLPSSGIVTSFPAKLIATPTTDPAASKTDKDKQPEKIVSAEDVASAIKASLTGNDQRKRWLENYQKMKNEGEPTDAKEDESSDEEKKEDPILAKVRASGNLNSHEERLLGGVIDTTQLRTGFEDVCIDPKIVDSVRMIISLPLMYPKAFASGILGAEALSGILLYGPPGTGKTMLCRAVAKECNVRMLLVAPSNVQDMYVGETEKLVKAIFTLARKLAPCVIFIDEVDALFGSRSSDNTNGSRYHRSMLTEFMQEMDGLNSASVNKKKGIVVIGATNRPFDLDDAVLRRLPRRMLLDLPGPREREQILRVHLKGETLEGLDISDLARRTNNFSGSDLKNLAVTAALASLKDIIPDMWNAKKTLKKGRILDEATKEDGDETNDKSTDPSKPLSDEPDSKDDDDAASEAGSDSDSDSDSDDDEGPELPARVLRPIHFKAAFEQVSATCSRDMASVQRLRSWASQFSRDSGVGLGAIPATTGSAGTASTTTPGTGTGTSSTTTPPTGGSTTTPPATTSASTFRSSINSAGGGPGALWDNRYESSMLSRFSNLPRPGSGSGASGASGSSSRGGSGAGGSAGGSSSSRGGGSGSGSGSGNGA